MKKKARVILKYKSLKKLLAFAVADWDLSKESLDKIGIKGYIVTELFDYGLTKKEIEYFLKKFKVVRA